MLKDAAIPQSCLGFSAIKFISNRPLVARILAELAAPVFRHDGAVTVAKIFFGHGGLSGLGYHMRYDSANRDPVHPYPHSGRR